ncbi:MAG: hypothetical protein IJ692_06785 [Alloprevotella sp.]|nr:hypothetical protein [Bacteroidaceae bacterium]MBR1594728.1 hypothetical protein [Alloprevotella sp.]MBR1595023.1 hypothetical protein [Alloprevotella sp.]MBR1653077.1 hypothetical protein [Alloprevotella sp.]
MSEKDYLELSRKFDEGLELAEKRMLQEKALRGESVVICDSNNHIKRIPAQQIIAENPFYQ